MINKFELKEGMDTLELFLLLVVFLLVSWIIRLLIAKNVSKRVDDVDDKD